MPRLGKVEELVKNKTTLYNVKVKHMSTSLSYGFNLANTVELANSTTDANLLKELATHPDSLIRTCVAENRHTPFDTLKLLAFDEFTDVSDCACQALRNRYNIKATIRFL